MDRAKNGPGRPRTEGLDEKILGATVNLIDSDETVSVNAVVEESGVSRASIYRRWPSLRRLMADALDQGRAPVAIDTSRPIKDSLEEMMFARPQQSRGANYPDRRFRKRIELSMADRELQQDYWETSVSQRRVGFEYAIQVAIDRGEVRPDTNPEAVIDAINGAFYYQVTARGASMTDPDALARCKDVFDMIWDMIWRGIES